MRKDMGAEALITSGANDAGGAEDLEFWCDVGCKCTLKLSAHWRFRHHGTTGASVKICLMIGDNE